MISLAVAVAITGAAIRITNAGAAKPTTGVSPAPPFKPIAPVVPRAAGDVVPRSADIVKLSWSQTSHQTFIVSSVSKVRQIAQVLNTLPVEGTGTCSQAYTGPQITFTFLNRLSGDVLASASEVDTTAYLVAWCIPTFFSVRGHRSVDLEGGGFMIKKTEAILGQKLT